MEEALKVELSKAAAKGVAAVNQPDMNEVGNVLAAYKNIEGDPNSYEAAYRCRGLGMLDLKLCNLHF